MLTQRALPTGTARALGNRKLSGRVVRASRKQGRRERLGKAPGAGEGGHPPQVHQEDVLDLLQDLQLPEHVAHLVALDALLLVHVLHGVHLLGVPLLHDAHLESRRNVRAAAATLTPAAHGTHDPAMTGCLWWGRTRPRARRWSPGRTPAVTWHPVPGLGAAADLEGCWGRSRKTPSARACTGGRHV